MWIVQMECAEQWGKPPHEVFGGSVVLWWHRWKTRRDLMLLKDTNGKQNRD
jgi:hypothetical protein